MPAKRGGVPIAPTQSATDVAVIGGGVIGLAIAWRPRARGLGVTVLDRREYGSGPPRLGPRMPPPLPAAAAGEAAPPPPRAGRAPPVPPVPPPPPARPR